MTYMFILKCALKLVLKNILSKILFKKDVLVGRRVGYLTVINCMETSR